MTAIILFEIIIRYCLLFTGIKRRQIKLFRTRPSLNCYAIKRPFFSRSFSDSPGITPRQGRCAETFPSGNFPCDNFLNLAPPRVII